MASRKIKLGSLLLCLGIVGLFVAIGPARFLDRFSGRVDVVGTVQWGVSVDARSADDKIEDGQSGVWKVDYEIDGASHTGAIVGAYHAGQELMISAPSDGSFYSPLREASSLPMKILSWFLAPLALAATLAGGWMLIGGVRTRDRESRAQAHAQLSRRYPHLFPPPGAIAAGPQHTDVPGSSSTQVIAAPQKDDPPQRKTDFYAPYDL